MNKLKSDMKITFFTFDFKNTFFQLRKPITRIGLLYRFGAVNVAKLIQSRLFRCFSNKIKVTRNVVSFPLS